MDYLRSDCILAEILEDRKSLTGFLDAIFGFMSRHTDFYHVQNTKDDKVGFPRGVKEQILISCMQKYEHTLDQQKLLPDDVGEVPPCVAEVEVVTEEERSEKLYENQQLTKSDKESINTTKFNKCDFQNGSAFDNYCWSQTLKDVDVNILLPKGVKLAKHIEVNFEPKSIAIKTLFPQETVLLNGEIWDKYQHNNVIWSISDGRLLISFDKRKQCWWDKLFLDENIIDSKTVDTEQSIDADTIDITNTIDKYNQEISTNDDIKNCQLNENEQIARLRQAWNAENSPFKGQPFDPSIIQFN